MPESIPWPFEIELAPDATYEELVKFLNEGCVVSTGLGADLWCAFEDDGPDRDY